MEDFQINIPQQINLKEALFGLDFHPTRDLVAYSGISGTIQIQQYVPDEPNTLLMELNHHSKSCRSVAFSQHGGDHIFSCSIDRSVVGIDLETQKKVFEVKKAHSSGINTMLLHEHLIFTGDEEGVIKIWDQRKPDRVKEINENEDYISSLSLNSDRKTLLATSGDQTLTVIDYGSGKAIDRSEEQDDELLSCAVIKGGRKAVCGTQNGMLAVFSWDQWFDRSSAFPGHPDSIDCMVAVDDSTIITGCGDGIIRIVSILPNKILGVVSAQSEEMPITSMAVSRDKRYLAACVDTSVQFWNVSMLYDDDGEPEEDEEEDQVVEHGDVQNASDEIVDEEEDEAEEEEEGELEFEMTPSSEDESSSSDSESSDIAARKPIKKGSKTSEARASFFDDL